MPKTKNKNDQSSKITHFFSVGQSVANANNIPRNKVNDFYASSVNHQLNRDKCGNQACARERKKLQQQLEESKEKKEQTKELIRTCEEIIEKKNHTLNLLRSQLNECVEAENRSEAKELFEEYQNDFTRDGLRELRSIGGTKTDDSKFILTGMRFLYDKKLHRLASITVTGRGKKGKNNSEKMSPKKMVAIKGAYTERLKMLKLEEREFDQRSTRINIHINNAIQNLNPKNNQKQRLDALNEQINSAANLSQ